VHSAADASSVGRNLVTGNRSNLNPGIGGLVWRRLLRSAPGGKAARRPRP